MNPLAEIAIVVYLAAFTFSIYIASSVRGGSQNPLAGIAIVVYFAAFAFAVYDCVPISDWLASHLFPL